MRSLIISESRRLRLRVMRATAWPSRTSRPSDLGGLAVRDNLLASFAALLHLTS